MSKFKVGDEVVVNMGERDDLYQIAFWLPATYGAKNFRISTKENAWLVQSVSKSEIRHATKEEIKAGRRLWKNI